MDTSGELFTGFIGSSLNVNSMDSDEEDAEINIHLLDKETSTSASGRMAETCFDHLLSHTCNDNPSFEGPAPELKDGYCYHLMFLHHPNETLWVEHVIDKLQEYEYKCCYIGQCLNETSVIELEEIMLMSERLVIIITSDLVSEFIYSDQEDRDIALFSELDFCNLGGKDAIGLWLRIDCDIPPDLYKLPVICVDDEDQGWWRQFVEWVTTRKEITEVESKASHVSVKDMANETSFVSAENGSATCVGSIENLDMDRQGTSTTAGLESGVLVTTVKSEWTCFGKEVFDKRLPEEFCYCQLQLSPDDFTEVVDKMMTSRRLRWHPWLHSAPCIGGGLLIMLVICLVGVPLVEDRLIFHDSQLGFEFVHGLVLWMLLLSVYLVTAHFLKLKVASDLNQRLTEVNTILVRSNILTTLEELGILEYSKLAGYLQDLIEPPPPCNGNAGPSDNQTSNAQTLQLIDRTTVCDIDISDTTILDPDVHTQQNAEDLIIEHSSQYLNTLLCGKLRTPATPRHLHSHLCLCQYLEYRLSSKTLSL